MEGQNNHGLVSVDLAYDDELLHSSGWSAPGDPQYSYPRHAQNQYAGYTDQLHLSQPTYEHFNVNHQATYEGIPYENQSFGTQFHRQPDNFAPTYPVNPSLQNSQAYQTQHRSYFTPQTNENATISPQTLQYNNGGQSHGSVRADPNIGFKTTTNSTPDNYTQRSQESTMYYNNLRNAQLSQNNATNFSTVSKPPAHEENCQLKDIDRVNPSISTLDVQQAQPIMSEEPTSQLRITRPDLQQSTNMSSRPRFDYAPYVVWEDTPFKITVGLKNTLPKYYPRRTKSGRELVPGFDLSKSLNPAQVSVKKRGSRRLSRELRASTNRSRGTSLKPKILTSKSNTSREDSNSRILNNQLDSGSETESSSESESEYDEEIRTADVSEIRGRNRPTDTAQAARWDTIGLIWKDPNSNPNATAIKDAIEKYANFLIALRLKIKANSTHLENSTRPGEISRVQSERQILLESLFQVISAAVEHGYDPIVENLGGHHKLVNGLTTTLIECIKADDFNGKLPKAVFSLLSKFKTLTDDLLKKLKFESIQKRWTKKGDEELKKTIAFILSNTVDARASKAKKFIDIKKLRNKVEPTKARSLETSNSATSSPVKRPHEVDAASTKPNKKVVSDMANSAAIAKSLIPKRGMSNLLGISTKPVKPPPPKRRDPSPPSESKLGALLASIAKDPEPPRAPELPTRAPENPQEKARRERKESRRHLRVKFKEGSELEEIRQFTHEQAEDEGRRDEMLRDAHDYRLEGIMHKKRVTEGFDDDDDYQPSDAEPLYPEPRPINFDYLEKTTRFGRTYSTRGGDLDVKTDEAKKQERREGLELMVVYTDPEDIPISPKEPMSLSSIEYPQPESQIKVPTEPWLVKRLQEIEKCGQEQASKMLFSSNTYKQNNSPEISSVLQKLGETSVQPTNRALEPPIDPSAYANLVFFVKYLSGKPFPAIEPPEWMSPEFKASWIEGYNRDLAIKNNSMGQGNNLNLQAQKLATGISMANPSYQHGFQVSSTPFSSVVSQSAYPISFPDVTQQMQNYLATYQARDKYPGTPQALNYNAWNPQIANFQNEQPSTSRQGYPQRWEVARELEGGRSNQQEKTNSKKKEHDNKAGHGPPFEEKVEHKSKKKRRRYWSDGKRNKGRKGNSHS